MDVTEQYPHCVDYRKSHDNWQCILYHPQTQVMIVEGRLYKSDMQTNVSNMSQNGWLCGQITKIERDES